MATDEMVDTLARIYGAEAPWAEIGRWLDEHRDQNRELGGDDDAFIAAVVFQLLTVPLPLISGGRP